MLPKSTEIPLEFIRQEPWEIEYLYSVASRSKVGILETGRFNGGSALIFAHANKNIPIYSIDISPQDDARLMGICKKLAIGENLNLIIGDSQNSKYKKIVNYDLLFIDGDHSYKGCMNDLKNWWDQLTIGGHVILHDCYLGSEVQDAVIDFLNTHSAQIVLTPFIASEHWRFSTGSLCHFIKLK